MGTPSQALFAPSAAAADGRRRGPRRLTLLAACAPGPQSPTASAAGRADPATLVFHHIAETAWQQGVNPYGPTAGRLRAAAEFHARYQLGEPAPRWLCGGRIERSVGPDVEVLFNQLQNRLHLALPATRKLAEQQQPGGTDDLFVAWETLTHAQNPGAPV
ncbi:hypothetical protein [Streptomyces hundungensis]|uniref:hypothetical protein n=1 Tax=Streptomyces hundungensis TaxID=1077946 RepID=UPI0033D60F84